jgi:hypothetical protein
MKVEANHTITRERVSGCTTHSHTDDTEQLHEERACRKAVTNVDVRVRCARNTEHCVYSQSNDSGEGHV